MWFLLHKQEPLKFLIAESEKRNKRSWHYKAARNMIQVNYAATDDDNVGEIYEEIVEHL